MDKPILQPVPPKDMVLQGGLYLPKHLTKENREGLMSDAGTAAILSHEFIFGRLSTAQELAQELSKSHPRYVLMAASRIANHLAHNGIVSAARDGLQGDSIRALLNLIQKRGLQLRPEAAAVPPEKAYCVSADSINSLLPIVLSLKDNDSNIENEQEELERLVLAIIMANDFAYGSHHPAEGYPDLYLSIIRQLLSQAAFAGAIQTFARRIWKFHRLYSRALTICPQDLVSDVNEYLRLETGVTLNELISLIPILNVVWISTEPPKDTIFNIQAIEKREPRELVTKFLATSSLTSEKYREGFLALATKYGDAFFNHSESLAFLVRYPFLHIREGIYLLLGPHLLLRRIETAVLTAFVLRRSKSVPVQSLYGPLGIAFEEHCGDLLQRKFPASAGSIATYFQRNPKREDGTELCDAIIDIPDCCVVFEKKFRPPSLHALDVEDPSYLELKKWIETTFLDRPEKAKEDRRTRGALWQLRGAIEFLLSGKRGYQPTNVVPVVVISEAVLSALPFYGYLDRRVKELSVFDGLPGATPFLIISEAELSYLTSMDFSGSRFSLQTLFREKSVAEGARIMSWAEFSKRVGLVWKLPADQEEGFREIMSATAALFEEPAR